MYLRMTDRGFDLLPFPHYISWTIQNDGNWQSPDLTTLVPSGSAPTSSDSKCCVHMSVWQAPVGEKIRASSGPFSVGS